MEGLKPSLREREHRELPVAREQAWTTCPKEGGRLEKLLLPKQCTPLTTRCQLATKSRTTS